MDYIKAFLVGGALCAIAQILMEKTKMMPGRIMVTYVVSGVILGFLGLYEPLVKFAGCGATVPLTGFGYNLFHGLESTIAKYGITGLFMGGFEASCVGRCAALVFSYLAALIFKPQMKK